MSVEIDQAITLSIEVAFEDALTGSPTWTDITDQVRGEVTITRGRGSELETTQPGELEFTVDNRTRAFDPFNTASSYYPYVEPMKQVRVTLEVDSYGTFTIWQGFIDSWRQVYDGTNDATCEVKATDYFKVLANETLPQTAYEFHVQALEPTSWYQFSEEAEADTAIDVAGTSDGSFDGSPITGITTILTDASGAGAFSPQASDAQMIVENPLLIDQYPFSVAFVVQCEPHRSGVRALIWAQNNSTDYAKGVVTLVIHGNPSADSDKGKLRMVIDDGLGNKRAVFGSSFIDDGEPHQVTMVSEDGDTWAIYVDGVAETLTLDVATSTGTYVPAFPSSLALGWAIGNTVKPGSFGAFPFSYADTDVIDDVAIWNGTALTSDQAEILAFAMTGRYGDISGTRIVDMFDLMQIPFGYSIDTGVSVLGTAKFNGQSMLDYFQTVALSENGNFFMEGQGTIRFRARHTLLLDPVYNTSNATLGDAASSATLKYSGITIEPSDHWIYNDVRIARDGGTTQIAKDQDSIDRYMTKGYSRSNLLNASDNEMRDQAQWIVAKYKSPIPRIDAVELNPLGNVLLWKQIAQRELDERVTIENNPVGGGSPIEVEAHIEQIEHRFNVGGEWKTSWTLSPADVQTNYGVWDSGQEWDSGVIWTY